MNPVDPHPTREAIAALADDLVDVAVVELTATPSATDDDVSVLADNVHSAVATVLRAVPAQWRGANGDYVTIGLLRELARYLDPDD